MTPAMPTARLPSKYTARRELSATQVPESVALKLVCDQTDRGELRLRFRDAAEPSTLGLEPVRERPWWLTEAVLDDAIWNSDRALSWLAGGEAVTAYRQPDTESGPSTGKWPDYMLVGRSVRIIELEKDGVHKASQQLLEQLGAAISSGLLANSEDVQLVALDAAATRPPGGPAAFLSRCWHLATDAAAPMARWIVLSDAPHASGGTRNRRNRSQALAPLPKIVLPSCPFDVYLTYAPTLTHEVERPALTVHIGFHSNRYAKKRESNNEPTFIRKDRMMKDGPRWLRDLGHHVWAEGRLSRLGALGWEVWHAKGRGGVGDSAELLVHFHSEGPESVGSIVDLVNTLTWPDTGGWA